MNMDAESLQLLELSEVLELVAGRAHSESGRVALRARRPSTSIEWIDRQRVLLEELNEFFGDGGTRLELRVLDEPVEVLDLLEGQEAFLDGAQLFGLLHLIRAHRAARAAFSTESRLGRLVGVDSVADTLAAELERSLEPEGGIRDAAHPRLAGLRRRQATLRGRIRNALEAVLQGPKSRYLIEEPYITERGGRSVVPVKRDSQARVPGIVHGLSGSGATVFVEPMAVVELNNELQLAGDEEAELKRTILKELSGRARKELQGLRRAARALAELDVLFAVQAFGHHYDGRPAELVQENRLLLEEARHPLLVETLGPERVVPITVELTPAQRVLIISGPNTGGKTVALKTIGLLCLLAHCGLPVPARLCRLPRLAGVWADIGDHQSIAEQLSTFSAHVRRLSLIESVARPPCLILLDEAGRGTDPASGAALAGAIVEHLLDRGALVVATTHHSELKYLAASRQGMVNAGVQLDSETLAPTYEIEMGVAATSSGLEIARQIGLSQALLDAAAALRDDGENQVEQFLNELRRRQDELADLQEGLEQERERLESRRREIEAEARRDGERRTRDYQKQLEKMGAEFRKQAGAYLATIENRQEKARVHREAQAREVLLKDAFRRKMKSGSGDSKPAGAVISFREGDMVTHAVWKTGRVVRNEGQQVVVDFGGKRITALGRELRPSVADPRGRSLPANVSLSATETGQQELNLVGQRVDEALAQADKFLDQAVVSGLDEIVIIHGFGTGRLQRALARFLTGHIHVASHQPRGGSTTVTLHA